MKSLSLIVLMSLSVSAFAQELKHEAFCKSEDVKSISGEKGACSLFFTLKKALPQNAVKCTGTFMNVIPCSVTFTIGAFSSSVLYSCGTDPIKPLLKQTISPQVTAYNVAAVVTLENHEQIVVNDSTSYTNLTGRAIKVDFETSLVDGMRKQKTAISLKMADWTDLTGVICNY